MTGLYKRALRALAAYEKDKTLPPFFDRDDMESKALNEELQSLADEYQDDIDNAQRELEKIERFGRAWDRLKG